MERVFRYLVLCLFLHVATPLNAEDFFDVQSYNCQQQEGESSFDARVDFPSVGPAACLIQARQWVCEVLGIDAPLRVSCDDFPKLLEQAADEYVKAGYGQRSVEIEWAFEDPDCVTFLATVRDRDSVIWTSQDCATFSKEDGHRLSAEEVFNCSESQIKKLMWQFRGDLPMEVSRAEDLYVGDVGFIDGWIVVIGPARNYTGAAYKIRYQIAEPYLKHYAAGYYGE
ncbi:MAG: hypothetical protein ACOYJG_05515 [Prevotella sp.]|jgi:hypothetical protein